jgi:hypothetical protein
VGARSQNLKKKNQMFFLINKNSTVEAAGGGDIFKGAGVVKEEGVAGLKGEGKREGTSKKYKKHNVIARRRGSKRPPKMAKSGQKNKMAKNKNKGYPGFQRSHLP